MASPGFGRLLAEVERDLHTPELVWQLAAIVLALLCAFWLSRRVRAQGAPGTGDDKAEDAAGSGRYRYHRLVFPLAALGLVWLARLGLAPFFRVNLLSLALALLLSLAAIRLSMVVLRQALPRAGWLATFERSISGLVWVLVALHILDLLEPLVIALEAVQFSVGKSRLDLWLLFQGALTALLTLLAAMWLGGVLEQRLMSANALDMNVRVVLARLAYAVLTVVGILVALPAVGIDVTTLSVFGGALGVGLGFGLQKIASNYVAGFILLLDRSIRLGNLIRVDRYRGEVTQITTRYTVLRSLAGVEAIVPNELLIGSVVENETYTNPRMRVALPVQVAYDAPVERALDILVAAARAQERVLADPEPLAFVTGFADSGIQLELGYWIDDPRGGTIGVSSAIYREVLRAFGDEHIVIPYPQRELRLMKGEAGPSV
ncbi:MAG: hypothetical protein AMXMBFR6_08200 [Betaproteobacteria bacterium]|nr:mechanosensitive ion channel [Rhodocyclaceae bacterium]MCG3187934.1 hypothetical protein [Rhodocyclaceae bacterium]